jgi:hypothetical protein
LLFNSYAFLAVFLPAVLAGFFVLRALVTIGWVFFRMRNVGAIADVLTGLAGANVFRRRAYPFVDLNDPPRGPAARRPTSSSATARIPTTRARRRSAESWTPRERDSRVPRKKRTFRPPRGVDES